MLEKQVLKRLFANDVARFDEHPRPSGYVSGIPPFALFVKEVHMRVML